MKPSLSLFLLGVLGAGWVSGPRVLAAQPAPVPAAAGVSKELLTLLALPEKELDLGKGALLISKEEHPSLDLAAKLKTLDALGERLAAALAQAGTAHEKLGALGKLLFEQEQYGLPEKDEAAAFLLSDVLERKRGNCLGLSVLCLAVAERAGLGGKLFGVPVPSRLSGPGHLLLRYSDGATAVNFDPVERGAEHPNAHYEKLFRLKAEDLKRGYILGNATRKDVLNLLLVNLGGARVEAGQSAKALGPLEQALLLKPGYAPVHNNLGAARLSLGDLEGAEQAYKRALELDSGLVGAHVGLAEVYLKRGLVEKAEEEALTAEALEPENPQAHVLMANVYMARNEFRAARAEMAGVVRAAPKDLRARCNLGTVCRISGDFVEAEKAFRDALALDPHSADAHLGLGEVLRSVGQAKEAAAEFAEALKASPEHVPTRLAQAQMARQAGDLRTAESAYEAVLKAQPSHLEALGGLTEVLSSQGKAALAERRIAEAVKANPGHAGLGMLWGDTRLKAGNVAGAMAAFQAALKAAAAGERVALQQRIAVCHGKQQNHRLALEMVEEILKSKPNDLASLRVAGAACEGLRNTAKAIEFYRKILALDPADQQAKKALARLNAKE